MSSSCSSQHLLVLLERITHVSGLIVYLSVLGNFLRNVHGKKSFSSGDLYGESQREETVSKRYL